MSAADVTGQTDHAPGSRSGLVWALVVSVALNLLVAGAVGGAWIAHHRLAVAPPMGPIARVISRLPEDRRAILRPFITQQRAAVAAFGYNLTAARRKAADVLSAETIDTSRLQDALKRLFDVEHDARISSIPVTVAFAQQLTREERVIFLQMLDHGPGQSQQSTSPAGTAPQEPAKAPSTP
jgi:uncharacterized membrane protein